MFALSLKANRETWRRFYFAVHVCGFHKWAAVGLGSLVVPPLLDFQVLFDRVDNIHMKKKVPAMGVASLTVKELKTGLRCAASAPPPHYPRDCDTWHTAPYAPGVALCLVSATGTRTRYGREKPRRHAVDFRNVAVEKKRIGRKPPRWTCKYEIRTW